MSRPILIVGAGMGGLLTALRLNLLRHAVRVLEARSEAGGLASGFDVEGFPFDAGPYILLDRPGLERAFAAVDLDLPAMISLQRIKSVYQVQASDGSLCRFHADLAETAAGFERDWPGSGARYRRFVEETGRIYTRLSPLLQRSRLSPLDLILGGAASAAPFLLRSLGEVLARTGLPRPVCDAIGIWTHVAGERMATAPSPLAFVPSLIHTVGAYYPVGGIRAVARSLTAAAERRGVAFRYGCSVKTIRTENGVARGVELTDGEFIEAPIIVSNAGGIGTYCEMVDSLAAEPRAKMSALPLQSPGACAYLALQGESAAPYLKFMLPAGEALCRLLITPAVMDRALIRNGWHPARLLSPMRHETAEQMSADRQEAHLDRILDEPWWREGIGDCRVLFRRTPHGWGSEYNLYRNSMNPVMTARFMRQGRLAHRSPYVRGLYLAGSATHPGQWVSFCALSGVLAADCVHADVGP